MDNTIEDIIENQCTEDARNRTLSAQRNTNSEIVSTFKDKLSPKSKKKIVLNTVMELIETSSESEGEDDTVIINSLRARSDIFTISFLYRNERLRRNSIKNYFNEIIPTYTEWSGYKDLRKDKRMSEKLHMVVFLWFAGHEACSFSDLSDRFNLSRSTISIMITRVTSFISSLSSQTIKWPSESKKLESSMFFENKCSFPKVIGCIDGTHIRIDPPVKGKDDYIDRKGDISICLQGICDENKKFINIFVGYPGSSHDSWVFKNSPIYEKLPAYCGDYYLLGDSAYPCNKYLITPYKDNGHLTSAQKLFNIKLSSARVAVEHTFGILKQRFRQLYYCKLRGMKKICHFVRACCVLHNIANNNEIQYEDGSDIEENEGASLDHIEIARGNSVRDPLCQHLHTIYN